MFHQLFFCNGREMFIITVHVKKITSFLKSHIHKSYKNLNNIEHVWETKYVSSATINQ